MSEVFARRLSCVIPNAVFHFSACSSRGVLPRDSLKIRASSILEKGRGSGWGRSDVLLQLTSNASVRGAGSLTNTTSSIPLQTLGAFGFPYAVPADKTIKATKKRAKFKTSPFVQINRSSTKGIPYHPTIKSLKRGIFCS